MIETKRTTEFSDWLKSLDPATRAKVLVRVIRLENGNPGDVAPIGDGASEMRLHHGPGYRVYFATKGQTTTLIFGGTKSTQSKDIKKALKILGDLEV